MGLWFILLAALPVIYNLYNSNNNYFSVIPMQSSKLQSFCFMIFMLSMYCTASMLPCGRYYYAPEGGYVGNPWVKFSYQYCYLYLGWIVHHLDLIEHHCFRYSRHIRNHSVRIFRSNYRTGNPVDNKTTLMFGKKTSNAYSIKNIKR